MRGRVWIAAAGAACGVACGGPSAAAAACQTGTHTFTSPATPAEQCYTVPAGVGELALRAIGARGGTTCSGATPGQGAALSADIRVDPGEVLYVEVGGVGGGIPGCADVPGAGGFNGGGGGGAGAPNIGSSAGGGGGGASDIRTVSSVGSNAQVSLGSRLIVAGGGGGADAYTSGGDAESDADQFGDDVGGKGAGPATPGAGGTGTGCPAGNLVFPGSAGAFGVGGTGGGDPTSFAGGGGGGGGYFGGGGGAGDNPNGDCGGGGGGGGSSWVTPTATNATVPAPTAAAASIHIAPLEPAASVGSSSVSFATTQPQSTVSAPAIIAVSNSATATADLNITSITVTGADPGDFLGADGCHDSIAPGGSCQLGIYFVPQASGARTATLEIGTDDPVHPTLSVALSGTGGSLPQGPTGSQGPAGSPGTVELVTCRTVTKKIHLKHHKIRRKKLKKCTTKVVTGPVKFTTG